MRVYPVLLSTIMEEVLHLKLSKRHILILITTLLIRIIYLNFSGEDTEAQR